MTSSLQQEMRVEQSCSIAERKLEKVKSNFVEHEIVVRNNEISSSSSKKKETSRIQQDIKDISVIFDQYPRWRKYLAVGVLFYINLLNYMDRCTIIGVLAQVKEAFQINNAMAGLLQTVFIISYMLVAPVFGYLGDRYNRKVIMIFGMILWSGFTFISSFISNPDHFPWFLVMRALVGIGEASYITIAPTIIGDLFVGDDRTTMLSVFFCATPIGSGLGFIVGSQMASAFGGWEWALRLTPALGFIAILLLQFLCPNPPRGATEIRGKVRHRNTHSYYKDLMYLIRIPSFIFSTIGSTSVAFATGCLAFWCPLYFAYGQIAVGTLHPCTTASCDYSETSFIFGVITCIGGFTGIALGVKSAKLWRNRGRRNAEPLVCASSLIMAAIVLLITLSLVTVSLNTSWILTYFSIALLCSPNALVGDMNIYIIEPNRRSSASAIQILICHLFGDAGCPYLVGLIADAFLAGQADTYINKYLALQYAMFISLFVSVFGGAGFILNSLYVVRDREKVQKYIEHNSQSVTISSVKDEY